MNGGAFFEPRCMYYSTGLRHRGCEIAYKIAIRFTSLVRKRYGSLLPDNTKMPKYNTVPIDQNASDAGKI